MNPTCIIQNSRAGCKGSVVEVRAEHAKQNSPLDSGLLHFGEEVNLKSEPAAKSAWGERERGWESPFAFERSGSSRAGGAAPKKRESCSDSLFFGDPYGTRTHVTAVKGRCLNHLTNGPYERRSAMRCALFGSGTWIRTGDTSGMNRMLWPTELCRHLLPEQHMKYTRMSDTCQHPFCVFSHDHWNF